MRDTRDPQALGEAYLAARARGRSIEQAVKLKGRSTKHNHNPSCIDKYGSADKVKPRFQEVQVR